MSSFELVWNRDLNIRFNFFLKNPVITRVASQEDNEINTEKIEKILKEKINNFIGTYVKFDLDIDIGSHSVLLPENPNSSGSAFIVSLYLNFTSSLNKGIWS